MRVYCLSCSTHIGMELIRILFVLPLLVLHALGDDCAAVCQGAGDGLVAAGCCQNYCVCSGGTGFEVACRGPTGFCSASQSCIRMDECMQGEGCCADTTPCPPSAPPSPGCSAILLLSHDTPTVSQAVCYDSNMVRPDYFSGINID